MLDRPYILLVDDRPENLYVLAKTLEETGARMVKASSGEEALAATLECDFALAILDVQMPGMDGYELAEYLRGDPKTRAMPIIFLTAASIEEKQIFKGYESGAVDYIIKPYNPLVLISKVKVFLALYTQKMELQLHRNQLDALNKELEAFAYSVSHDLRTPLRAIDGFSQALLEDCLEKLDPMSRDFLQRISSEAQRMAQLIDDLLKLSRVTRADIRFEQVNISGIAHEIVERLHCQEPDRSIEISVADDLVADCDSRLLYQALENLLSNAWKFTGKTDSPKVEVGSFIRNGQTVFYIKDNGAGFDMQYADKLYTPFQRLHRMTEFPGTGVGLSTVYRIITRHGGTIWCDSETDKGSTFYFTLQPNRHGPVANSPTPVYENGSQGAVL